MSVSSESPGRAEARRLVKEIAKDHGYLGEDVLGRLDQETRRQIEEALLKKDLMIGSSVITLASNLYTSNARFIFELLQNADDNDYFKARASGAAPYVSFNVYPDRIVVECNEDGFKPENLVAICNIGKSSKTGAQGYIGEKGIGFKSVFMAAWKAHIQSGDFSFYFRHRKGDSGMGMISPQWQEPEHDLDGILTRITLFLHEAGDPVTLDTQREMIFEQLQKLQDTVLLFLKNIKRISIMFHNEEENLVSSTTYSIDYTEGENRVALEKVIIEDGRTEECKKNYYLIKHDVENLAKNENRTYSAEEESTKAYARAEVKLAFQLTDESIPIIAPQEVFAFLPIRHMGFTFLIQSDFVTQANRQDIVTTSARNLGLLGGIADAFVKAVLQFCESRHPILQYQWMRYLPKPDSYSWDSFWETLVSKIKSRLEETPVLRPRSERSLRLIKQLRRCSDCALLAGQPLFNDIEPEAYLSSGYRDEDLDILSPHGLKYMYMDEYIERVRSDLRSPMPKMKSPRTDNDWHSQAAKLLSIPFGKSWNNHIATLKAMNLLPLQDQQWVSANDGPIHYTESDGIPIPRDLNLALIDPLAARNEYRKALFDQLGVQEASTSYIRSLIIEKYENSIDPDRFDLSCSRRHLKYLYLTHEPQECQPSQLRHIKVYCQSGTLGMPHQTDFYISNNDQYGAKELLKETAPSSEPGAGAPGFSVRFLNQEYFNDTPTSSMGHSLQWEKWLHKYLKIRRHLRLTSTLPFGGQIVLSHVCRYLADCRPERFLSVLKYYWKFEGKVFEDNPSVANELRSIRVLCKDNQMTALSDTYLPTPSLESRCARFMNDTTSFPFLMLEAPLSEGGSPVEWKFLHTTFGVGLECDLDFYLAILAAIHDANDPADIFSESSRVHDLYMTIQAQCLESDNRDTQQSKVRDFFDLEYILIPTHEAEVSLWANRSECLWVAPSYMETKFPLESLYEGYLECSETDKMTLTQFFRATLEVPNATWRHFIDEIKHLNASNNTDIDRINSLYNFLDQIKSSGTDDDTRELKQAFEDNALIYVFANGRHGWYRVSECLWSSATAIRGKITLNEQFEGLKNFFVAFLGVAELNFAMVLDKLVESTAQSSVAEIKDTLWVFNSLLQDQDLLPSPEQILESYTFPVRFPNGQVELRTSRTDFAIVDRQHFGDAFADQAKLLDFGLDEIRRLKPFFQWVGLQDRYLSYMVKEISFFQGYDPTPISIQDRDVSRKAHGLFRIAVHYDSPRTLCNDQSLYRLLRNAHVYETDGISSQLVLSQDGRELSTEVARSELHIHEDESVLEIYVPRDTRSQDFCYRSKLPPRLLDWMMTQHTTLIRENVEPAAVLAANNVINANQSTIGLILEAAGIIEVEIPDSENGDDVETPALPRLRSVTPHGLDGQGSPPTRTPQSGSDGETLTLRTSESSQVVESSSQANHSAIDQEATYVQSQSRFSASGLPMQPTHMFAASQPNVMPRHGPSYSAPIPDGIGVSEDASYKRLLVGIVNAARRAVFPNRGLFNMSAMLNALPNAETFSHDSVDDFGRIRSASKLERDMKIGAAGELFVFELLSQLMPRLPDFTRDNWESTIRRYVTVHPEYALMDGWNGRETADITYQDVDSVLTELFIERGYLAQDQWRGIEPKYYIEVKSTPGPCNTPFYMSKHQYQRMKDSSNGEHGLANQHRIYVIFRVFNLYSDSIDVRIYMDPDAMRQRRDLRFTAEGWSIVPAPTLN